MRLNGKAAGREHLQGEDRPDGKGSPRRVTSGRRKPAIVVPGSPTESVAILVHRCRRHDHQIDLVRTDLISVTGLGDTEQSVDQFIRARITKQRGSLRGEPIEGHDPTRPINDSRDGDHFPIGATTLDEGPDIDLGDHRHEEGDRRRRYPLIAQGNMCTYDLGKPLPVDRIESATIGSSRTANRVPNRRPISRIGRNGHDPDRLMSRIASVRPAEPPGSHSRSEPMATMSISIR